jgi:hypothetical protein
MEKDLQGGQGRGSWSLKLTLTPASGMAQGGLRYITTHKVPPRDPSLLGTLLRGVGAALGGCRGHSGPATAEGSHCCSCVDDG